MLNQIRRARNPTRVRKHNRVVCCISMQLFESFYGIIKKLQTACLEFLLASCTTSALMSALRVFKQLHSVPLFLLSVLCLHHSSCHMHKGFVISEACGLAHVRRACSLTKVRETQQSCVLHINATVRIFLRHNKKLQTARLEFLLA